MVPHVLRLRNFMSYGDEPVEVDFDGLHLACLSGGNGHGKSALLDAMTWVLWGRSRAKREDDLVYQGAREMEVELQFSVGGGRYRAIRKRTLRGSGGTAALELQALGDAGYTSITGGTIAETQARLHEILKLSYETFINSTFLLQGRADEFTVKPPAQRKAVLGEILGLEEYDRLAERARERGRDLAARGAALRDAIAVVEGDLARRPLLHAELLEKESLREAATAAVRLAEQALWEARSERQRLESEQKTLDSVRQSIAALQREIETLARRRDEALRVQGEADDLLRHETTIITRAAELGQARRELEQMGAHAVQFMTAQSAVTALRHEIELVASGLRHEMKNALAEAETLARQGAEAPVLRRQVEEYARGEARIQAIEDERAALAEELQQRRSEVAALESENARLEQEMGPLRERLRLLQERSAACPVCGASMSDEERARVADHFRAEGVTKREQRAANEARIKEVSGAVTEAQAREAGLAGALAALHKQARELAALRQRLEAAEAAGEAERAARARAEVARQALAGEEYAPDARARLSAAAAAVLAVGYDAERHEAQRQRAGELAGAEEKVAELATARERRANAVAALAEAAEDIQRRQAELRQADESALSLDVVLAALPEIETRLAAGESALVEARRREDELHRHIAAFSERLRQLDAQEESLREKRVALAALEREGDAYTELGKIFGKRGIQAMIIDGALPELERGANAILARMSDNGMQVQFSTQKETAKGDLQETLDITIADASGTRPYEMFSGGEAFRVNFAIRIALSRLLAERAGAQLQMLVIDEGFGTQDSQGRERLVEAISSIAADFERIVVITHIDELKDLFSTRIDVVKGLNGSRVTVTAA